MGQNVTIETVKLDANESSAYIEVATLYPKQGLGNPIPLPYITAIIGGTFNTGTVTVDVAADSSGTGVIKDTTTYTAVGVAKIEVVQGFYIRFTMAGIGTDDVDIYYAVFN